jgi:hypothetical protein
MTFESLDRGVNFQLGSNSGSAASHQRTGSRYVGHVIAFKEAAKNVRAIVAALKMSCYTVCKHLADRFYFIATITGEFFSFAGNEPVEPQRRLLNMIERHRLLL